jgi:serine/threonine protein kinase
MRHPQNPSTSKNDLWSTGCIFHEMVFGLLPVGSPKTFDELVRKVVDQTEFSLPDDDVNHLSRDGRDLLVRFDEIVFFVVFDGDCVLVLYYYYYYYYYYCKFF